MSRFILAAFVFCVLTPVSPAAGPYDELLKAIPPQTNTLVLIDVKAAFASPLAKAEKWLEGVRQRPPGLGFIPPEAQAVVIGSEVNLSSLTREHQVGLVQLRDAPTTRELSNQENGTVDDINDQLVVLSPRDTYFIVLPGSQVAAVYPADRQSTARWLKYVAAKKGPELAPYLMQAAAKSGESTMVIALDLAESIDSTILKFGLAVSPALIKHKFTNIDLLAKFISKIQGLTFTARITDRIEGKIKIDFASDPTRYKTVLKDLFLELIEEMGVAIPGLEGWQAVYDETSMTLTGSLLPADLRRIISLFAFPQSAGSEAGDKAPNPAAGKDDVSAPATQRYLAAVQAVLGDLKSIKDSPNFTKTATWYEKTASQLEQISRRKVDKIAVETMFEISKRLRAIAGSLKGVPIDVHALEQKSYLYAQRYPSYGFGGWWGGWRSLAFAPTSVQTNIPQVQGEIARVIADDQKRRISTWGQIDDLISIAKAKLTDKFKADF